MFGWGDEWKDRREEIEKVNKGRAKCCGEREIFFFFFNAYKESLQGKTQPWREKTSALTLIQMLVRVRVVTQQGAFSPERWGN